MALLPTSERIYSQPGNPSISIDRLSRSKTLACVFLLVWTGYHFYPSMSNGNVGQIVGKHSQMAIPAEDFVSTAVQTTIDSYDAEAVHQYCHHDNWNTSIVVNCDRIFGGIGNTRQRILTCLRHAMHEGWSFIVPSISLRSNDDLSLLESDGDTSLDYTFNRDLFVSRLAAACPQMAIYDNVENATSPELEIFHYPTRIGQLKICDDPAGFATHFGSLLTFPAAIYRLAFSVLNTLSDRYHLSISPYALFSPAPYMGVHLRTSEDAIKAGWSSYEVQSKHYLSLAASRSFSVIYVASGNATSVFQFTMEAAALEPPITIVTKEDLISTDELKELRALSWDQAALIDYVVLQSAGYFAGLTESSFTWNVAMKRAATRGREGAVCREVNETEEGIAWRDEWSEIMGNDPTEFMGKLWP